ncbi:MAG: alpha/beta hydrolase family protein [Lentisphaerota bacterium]
MSERNLSPQNMFMALVKDYTPAMAYTGGDVEAWRQKTLPEVLRTLGNPPPPIAGLNPELLVEWRHEGLLKQKWLIDVSKHISATFLINRPEDIPTGQKLPALFCCHGHGPDGKEPVMGNDSSPGLKNDIERLNYDYGQQMAQAGFVTFAIDWIGFGERNDSKKPNHYNHASGGRDWCNLYYLHATMLGMTSLGINIAHGRAATDFACTFEHVDPARLGVMGLSGGGTMALWLSLCDERFKATEIICYSDLWSCFGIRDVNYCGMQIAPGLFNLVDVPDLQGLLAPRPLLVDVGIYDETFKIDSANVCCHKVQMIYEQAGAGDKFEQDLFPGAHKWSGRKSLDFFNRYLKVTEKSV